MYSHDCFISVIECIFIVPSGFKILWQGIYGHFLLILTAGGCKLSLRRGVLLVFGQYPMRVVPLVSCSCGRQRHCPNAPSKMMMMCCFTVLSIVQCVRNGTSSVNSLHKLKVVA